MRDHRIGGADQPVGDEADVLRLVLDVVLVDVGGAGGIGVLQRELDGGHHVAVGGPGVDQRLVGLGPDVVPGAEHQEGSRPRLADTRPPVVRARLGLMVRPPLTVGRLLSTMATLVSPYAYGGPGATVVEVVLVDVDVEKFMSMLM